MSSLPTGTVTLLFTDIEGSTTLAQQHPNQWETLRARHDAILQAAVDAYNGYVFQIIGDAFCVAFHTASDGFNAAIDAQRKLQHEDWGNTTIKVRMGLHIGSVELQSDGQYRGYLTLAKAQRVMSVAHGGQVLLSNTSAELLHSELQNGIPLRDMKEHRLKGMSDPEHLWQLVAPDLQSDFPPLQSLTEIPNNLPPQLTNFIGREKELAEVENSLAQNRLVTLIGSGGTGKTRLAIEAGSAVLSKNHFTNGVFFVALAPLETAEAIVPTIASSLGFSFYEGGEPRQQLLNYLREKCMLLIMDNFEHLLSGVDLLSEILNTAPNIKVLATSRARLNVQGEQLFHLTGMDFPNRESPQDAIEYSAVKLFIQTAHRVRPDFELTVENMRYIVRLCRLVDGIPLGILLAASWMEMLLPEEIAGEVEKGLDFLESRQRDLPDRQHSMRAVFDYSWKLLTLSEQNVFMKSSVFRGGFTREAAQQVTGASLRDLMGLVDKSLLPRSPSGRFEIHELLRQYGAEKLVEVPDESEAVRNRHSAYFADYLRQRETVILGKGQKQAIAEITVEFENVRAAWDWAFAQSRITDIANSLDSLAEFYRIRALYERGEEAFGEAIQMLVEEQKKSFHTKYQLTLGKAVLWRGRFYKLLGLEEKSLNNLKESLVIFRELSARREEAFALCYLAGCDDEYGGSEREKCLEGLAIFKELNDKRGIALVLRGLAWVALHEGDYPTAKQYFQDSLTLFREIDYLEGITGSLRGIGYVSWILGQFQDAKHYHQEMLELSIEHGDQGGIARSWGDLAIDTFGFQRYEEAGHLWHRSFELYKEIGNKHGMDDVLGDLGAWAIALGKYEQAAQFAKESLSISQQVFGYDRAWSLRVLGEAAFGMGDFQQARKYLGMALKEALVQKRQGYIFLALVDIAKVLNFSGETDRALELLVFVLHHPASWQMARDWATPLIAELEAKLPPKVVAATLERGRARDLGSTVTELLEELRESA